MWRVPAIEFRDVARAVTCEDLARAEGLEIRHGRIQCPLHGGHNFNFKLGGTTGRGYCFKCGRYADSVSLAAALWHVSQREAAEELNMRFNLGLAPATVTAAERERRDATRQRERDLRERERKKAVQEWGEACEAERAAQQAIERFTEADVDKAEFNQALQRLCAAQLRCEMLQAASVGGC